MWENIMWMCISGGVVGLVLMIMSGKPVPRDKKAYDEYYLRLIKEDRKKYIWRNKQ